jgi:hypothetical protein
VNDWPVFKQVAPLRHGLASQGMCSAAQKEEEETNVNTCESIKKSFPPPSKYTMTESVELTSMTRQSESNEEDILYIYRDGRWNLSIHWSSDK